MNRSEKQYNDKHNCKGWGRNKGIIAVKNVEVIREWTWLERKIASIFFFFFISPSNDGVSNDF